MLTNTALNQYLDFTSRIISRATYTIGSTEYPAKVDRIEQSGSNVLDVYLVIDPDQNSNVVIKNVKIYDTGNKVFFEQPESISLSAYQEGILYKFQFKFTGEAN